MRALGPGALLGAWLIEEPRGHGGFAEVFRARHVDDGRVAAVKVLGRAQAQVPQLVRRFEQEAAVLARLVHPAIPAIFDRGVASDGRPWLAMRWIDGDDLDGVLARRGRLPLDEALALLTVVADALAAAHAAGVIHRDVKPANVLLERTADGARPWLIDFGIAKPLDAHEALARTADTMLGTPRYMAPEQLQGHAVDARTDVYALGLLAFELLSGRPAFVGDDLVELEAQHLGAPPPRLSEHAPAPRALDDVLARCLAKPPGERPPTIRDAIAQLAAACDPRRPPAPPPAPQAVVVEAHLRAGDDEPTDDDLDDMHGALELARAACRDAGLTLKIASGSTVLAIASDPAALAAFVPALRARLAERAGQTGRVDVVVRCVG